MAGPHHGGRMATNHGRPTIFTEGAPAPLVTSLAHDMTLAGGASFNGGIVLAAAVVDRALKGSMVGGRMNKIIGREVREKETI
jgi:hypothetical protein